MDVVPCCFVVPTRKEAHDRPWKKSINRNEPSLIKKIVERLILINILFFVKHKFSYGPSETRHSTGAGDEHERSNNFVAPCRSKIDSGLQMCSKIFGRSNNVAPSDIGASERQVDGTGPQYHIMFTTATSTLLTTRSRRPTEGDGRWE